MSNLYFTFEHKQNDIVYLAEVEITCTDNSGGEPAGYSEITDIYVCAKDEPEVAQDIQIPDSIIWDNFYIYLETQMTEMEEE